MAKEGKVAMLLRIEGGGEGRVHGRKEASTQRQKQVGVYADNYESLETCSSHLVGLSSVMIVSFVFFISACVYYRLLGVSR